MQRLMNNRWIRAGIGILFIVFGVGGLIAGLTGQTADSPRYVVGGIILNAVGIGNLVTAYHLFQRQLRSSPSDA